MVYQFLSSHRWLADQLQFARFAHVPGTVASAPRVHAPDLTEVRRQWAIWRAT
jgi:hypothetical protein